MVWWSRKIQINRLLAIFKTKLPIPFSQVEDETQIPLGYVRVTNYASRGGPATTNIIFGGPGAPYVGLHFRSQLNSGINSRIEIYERHQNWFCNTKILF